MSGTGVAGGDVAQGMARSLQSRSKKRGFALGSEGHRDGMRWDGEGRVGFGRDRVTSAMSSIAPCQIGSGPRRQAVVQLT